MTVQFDTQMLIGSSFEAGTEGEETILNPRTGETILKLPEAGQAQNDRAAAPPRRPAPPRSRRGPGGGARARPPPPPRGDTPEAPRGGAGPDRPRRGRRPPRVRHLVAHHA